MEYVLNTMRMYMKKCRHECYIELALKSQNNQK